MNPFYFGSRERRLFGVYHAAAARPVHPTGVVICPPILLEHMRSYRTFRQLAVELAGRGFHVLRFDYHGTGDSGGTPEAETLDGWIGDARTAARELEDLAGIKRVTLLGARVGAVVAVEAARGLDAVEDVVLWDPVVAGTAHVRWLMGRAAVRSDEGNGSAAGPGRGSPPPRRDEVFGVDGFPVTYGLLHDIERRALAGTDFTGLPVRRVVLAASSRREPSHLVRRLERNGIPHAALPLPDEASWEDPARQGDVVLAPRSIGEVTELLARDGEGVR